MTFELVVSNMSFLCYFVEPVIPLLLKMPISVPFFTDLARLDLKLKHHLMRRFLS